MAVSIDVKNNVCLKAGDTAAIAISTVGIVKAEVGDTATFMVKASPDDLDVDAIMTKEINVTVANEILLYLASIETVVIVEGEYYWSLKHTKGTEKYVVIPDGGCDIYPSFKVGGALINV